MSYANWKDSDWDLLLKQVRAKAPTPLTDSEIREAAFGYMQSGADGGHNRWGLMGTHIALCVDEVNSQIAST